MQVKLTPFASKNTTLTYVSWDDKMKTKIMINLIFKITLAVEQRLTRDQQKNIGRWGLPKKFKVLLQTIGQNYSKTANINLAKDTFKYLSWILIMLTTILIEC